nr:MAG TPA: hypothetical protein [Caudoviricetes sp.]
MFTSLEWVLAMFGNDSKACFVHVKHNLGILAIAVGAQSFIYFTFVIQLEINAFIFCEHILEFIFVSVINVDAHALGYRLVPPKFPAQAATYAHVDELAHKVFGCKVQHIAFHFVSLWIGPPRWRPDYLDMRLDLILHAHGEHGAVLNLLLLDDNRERLCPCGSAEHGDKLLEAREHADRDAFVGLALVIDEHDSRGLFHLARLLIHKFQRLCIEVLHHDLLVDKVVNLVLGVVSSVENEGLFLGSISLDRAQGRQVLGF